MKFKALVIPSGNATGVEVPVDLVRSLNEGARPPICITINGHTWRSRIALMRRQCLIGISGANRKASRIEVGDIVEVDIELDTQLRNVELPADIEESLNESPEAKCNFESLPFGLKRRHISLIEAAKSEETRKRRIDKFVKELKSTRQ